MNHAYHCYHFTDGWEGENREFVQRFAVATKVGESKQCFYCRANGYRVGISSVFKVREKGFIKDLDKQELIDMAAFDEGYGRGQLGGNSLGHGPYQPKSIENLVFPTGPQKWKFKPEAGMFGETFHLAVAKLLLPEMVAIQPNPGAAEANDFLAFYHLTASQSDGVPNPKKETTEVIRSVFTANSGNHDSVFQFIRESLERSPAFDKDKSTKATPGFYTTLSVLGEYYLSRSLALDHGILGELPPEPTDGRSKVALIYVRRGGLDTENRIMNDKNLEVCIEAVLNAANIEHMEGEEQRYFSHIILFGDFQTYHIKGWEEGLLKKTVRAKDRTAKVNVTFITQPWSFDASKLNKDDRKAYEKAYNNTLFRATQNFWAEYRKEEKLPFPDDGPKPHFQAVAEGAPLQVKNVALFLALKARYGDDICCIGFRSGFIDAAAFIGTPIFYIDSRQLENDEDPERWLWKPSLNDSDRMVYASNEIDTFIRLDIKGTDKWRLDGSLQKRLSAALYTYMLAGKTRPLWSGRVRMSETEGAKAYVEHALQQLAG